MIILKIYLKNRKKPLKTYADLSKLEKLYELLRTRDIIKFGPIIFRREDFIYAVEE